MSILLIKPYWPYPYNKSDHTYNRFWPPLELMNCAAILKKEGIKADILDAHLLRIKPNAILKHINGYDKIFISSSSLDRWQCPNPDISTFLKTSERILSVNSNLYAIGYHGTVKPNNLLAVLPFKAVIHGPPEKVIKKICLDVPFDKIENLSFLNDRNLVETSKDYQFNLETLPLPDFSILKKNNYNYEILGNKFTLLELGRGCKYSCNFCNKLMYGEKYNHKSIGQIRNEIEAVVEDFGVKTAYFIDLEFLTSKSLVKELCEFLIESKFDLKWCCQTRADSLNDELVKLMKEAGCELIHIGVEGGIQKLLDLSHKATSEDKILRGVRLCRKYGIQTLAFYLFGLKGETHKDREDAYSFAVKLNTTYISLHKAYPYLDNKIYDENVDQEFKINKFIVSKYLKYYLCLSKMKEIRFSFLLNSFKLFLGRILSIKTFR